MSESLFNEVLGEGSGDIRQLLYTKENLFKRMVDLEQQMETIKADIKAAKADFAYDEDMNPNGLPKEDVKEVAAFAKKYVAEKIEAVIEQAKMFESLKEELIGE